MNNSQNQDTGASRFLNLKNDDKDKKLSNESSFKTINPLQGSKSLFGSERTPASPAATPPFVVRPPSALRPPLSSATTSLASAPTPFRTGATAGTGAGAGQEQKKPLFLRQAVVDNTKEQKPSGLSTPPPSTLFNKPVSTAANTTPTVVAVGSTLSFKEKMDALLKKQAETRAAINTQQTVPVASVKAPFGNKAAVTAIFGEKKQAPLFTATRAQSDNPTTIRSDSIVPTQAKSDYKISDEEFTQLRDFLYEQSGIFVAINRKYLMENRLSSRLRELGLRNFNEYHNYLRFDNNRMTELNKLFENMTTNETSFFRNGPQLDVFKDKVLARIISEQRAKGQKKIHIWSAGCSSGEEPYTISIILHELLKSEIDSWSIKITANDLSLAMLETARKGLYSEYALRTTSQDMIDKYFTREGKMFRILPKVQKLVKFEQINLANASQLAKVERSHIVFCRNVIIYFDDEMKLHVINSFYDNLLEGGFLLIGHSESLHSISRAFVPEHFTGAIVYGKKS